MDNDLTQGTILKKLTFLALPIMATSFLQMAYNLTDMIWIGRLGASAVAAVGTAGFLMWLSFAVIALGRVGAEVKIAQTLGSKEIEKSNHYANTAITFTFLLGVLYGIILSVFKGPIIAFFNLQDPYVEALAIQYLQVIAFGMPLHFINQVLSGVFTGAGISKTPFRVNSIGLVMNLILDPIFIFVFDFGVSGAAYATILSQGIVTIAFVSTLIQGNRPYQNFQFRVQLHKTYLRTMLSISLSVALQNGLFTIISMFVARIVAMYGTSAIAVQKVGTQIEAISYMTAQGFGSALSAFIGQNYGAKRNDRVIEGFKVASRIMTYIGILTSLLLFFGAEPLFKIFINEEPTTSMGVDYLRIISISQLFMCIEITLTGGMSGLGRTMTPALIGVTFNAARIPVAYLLSTFTMLGINGIWWTISGSSIFKGVALVLMTFFILRHLQLMTVKKDNAYL
jgi:putative MATE family efflux protein